MALYRNCSLYKTMIESGDNEDEIIYVLDKKLNEFEICENDFDRIFNIHAYDTFKFYCTSFPEKLMHCYLFFGIQNYNDFMTEIIRITIFERTLHKILIFGIVEETIYNIVRNDKFFNIFDPSKKQYLFKVLYPQEYLLNFLTKENNENNESVPNFLTKENNKNNESVPILHLMRGRSSKRIRAL